MKIKVRDGLEIGDGCPTFIIAEVGSNWASISDCMTSISQAKLCGADAVKFQAFTHEALYGELPPLGYFMKGTLPLEWLPKLKEKCDAVGIEFMCSAFSPELLDAVNKYVNIHKLASAEMNHKRMLEKLRGYSKPVIMSTGAATPSDIGVSKDWLGSTPLVLLYCVAAYPARSVDLTLIPFLKNSFQTLVGYSDHTVDSVTIPLVATKYGACVIEKHVNFVGHNGPDAPHSLSTDEFMNMVSVLRGGGEIRGSKQEQGMITRHKRRLIATMDIEVGATFIEGENFGIHRSLKDDTKALHPFAVDRVNGKLAKNKIMAGDGIGPNDV